MMVHFCSYCNNKLHRIDVGDLTLWLSYETVVAFRVSGYGIRVCENVWGTTTGRHLNQIDGGDKEAKSRRLKYSDFKSEYNKVKVEVSYGES